MHAAHTTTQLPTTTDNWPLHTWRLARWVLFTAWRRVMGKILLGILVGFYVLIVALYILAFVITSNAPLPAGQNCPPGAVATSQSGQSGGPSTSPCQPIDEAQARAAQQRAANDIRQSLTFPQSLALGGGYSSFIGLILVLILAGAVIGGEYGYGTVRVLLSRGVGRSQLITAQAIALAVLALGVTGLMLLLSALVGFTLGPALGGTIPAFPSGGFGELAVYWLTLAFTLFAYGTIALFMATWARSTAAGIAVPLGFLVFETIVGGILIGLSLAFQGVTHDILVAIPTFLLGNNTSYLVSRASEAPIPLNAPPGSLLQIDLPHALVVTLLYCAVLLALSYVITQQRDVTD
jgi:ABC-type transport system involved in multi-copper enzyme maturation permease subunit